MGVETNENVTKQRTKVESNAILHVTFAFFYFQQFVSVSNFNIFLIVFFAGFFPSFSVCVKGLLTKATVIRYYNIHCRKLKLFVLLPSTIHLKARITHFPKRNSK